MAINPNFMGSNSPSGPTSTGKNMLEQAEELKGWPDQRLMQEYNSPTTATPQVVVLAELNRRADMRNRYQQQMANQPEVPPGGRVVPLLECLPDPGVLRPECLLGPVVPLWLDPVALPRDVPLWDPCPLEGWLSVA